MATLTKPAPASVSRQLDSVAPPPRLFHSLHHPNRSWLSLDANEGHIFSGNQTGEISVWDKRLYSLKTTLFGHNGSILALEHASDKKWLFSSSADSTVRVWCTTTLSPLYVLNPYLDTDAGDIYSLAWSPSLRTVYFGCQNTSLQWYSFDDGPTTSASCPSPSRKVHKFFDSYPQYQRRPADLLAANGVSTLPSTADSENPDPSGTTVLRVPSTNLISSAHYGYIYCMAIMPSVRVGSDDVHLHLQSTPTVQLVTGSGDESVKLWGCTTSGPSLLYTFECNHGAVLSVAVHAETLYAGCQDGYVKVLDLETRTLVRTIIVQENIDVLSLSMLHSDLYTCSANGQVQRWSATFDCTASCDAHPNNIILSSIISRSVESGQYQIVTGANDGYIKVWNIDPPIFHGDTDSGFYRSSRHQESATESTNDTMVYALSKFVSIPSISGSLSHREDCRQAAIWLKKCFNQLGAAQSVLVPIGEGTNPIVLATFQGTQGERQKKRILFYGHYDVISAPPRDWESDPFILTGKNGYLYGRGATDNKGPIMAVACGAAELLRRRALGVDLVLLIEGEEESGSSGFKEAVKQLKNEIGSIDAILVSNSMWIAEDIPCITYGLRGVIHCSLEISNDLPDLHSGVEGGAMVEPMQDMIKLLSTLTDGQSRIMVPEFYEDVRPLTGSEKEFYQRLSSVTKRPASSLSSRWREPSLTIHNIEVSGPRNPTVIPSKIKAQVSVRVVPDQNLEKISKCLCAFLKASFDQLGSSNAFEVNVNHTADWWIGCLDDYWFEALERAVREEWGVEPLRIREGGSIPSIPYLEKEFGCHALHLPLGQSSDQAHLPNERISLSNLRRGKSVIERFLLAVEDRE